MKLPEYDNRTSGEPLYSSKLPEPEGDFKFPAMIIGYPVLFVACVALVVYSIFY